MKNYIPKMQLDVLHDDALRTVSAAAATAASGALVETVKKDSPRRGGLIEKVPAVVVVVVAGKLFVSILEKYGLFLNYKNWV